MSAEIKEFKRPIPSPGEAFWQELAADPCRLQYWKEIAILWNTAARPEKPRLHLVGEN